MDIATIIGIIAAWFLIFLAILQGGDIASFIETGSMMITIGGTIGATFIAFPLGEVLGAVKVVMKAFLYKNEPPSEYVKIIVSFAETARREGMLALETLVEEQENAFLKKGLRLAVDGSEAEVIQKVLEIDMLNTETRHKKGASIFEKMGDFAPAFGMIGTLIGLIQMLKTLDDPSNIGAGMAVALLTTLYGALMANVLFLPLAAKLKLRSAEELQLKEMLMDGIMAIQQGDNPRVVEEKLKNYLRPLERELITHE